MPTVRKGLPIAAQIVGLLLLVAGVHLLLGVGYALVLSGFLIVVWGALSESAADRRAGRSGGDD